MIRFFAVLDWRCTHIHNRHWPHDITSFQSHVNNTYIHNIHCSLVYVCGSVHTSGINKKFRLFFTTQLGTRCFLGARFLARPGTLCNGGCTPLDGLVGDRRSPRLLAETTCTSVYGHRLSWKRPYTTTTEPGNKHDRYTVAMFADETGLLCVGNNDTFLLRDV